MLADHLRRTQAQKADPGKTVTSTYRFVTTAKASADAHAMVNPGWRRLDLMVDIFALSAGLIVAAAGAPTGLLLAAAAVLALVAGHLHPVQRWLISIRFRSLLGRTTTVTVDDQGVRFDGELASSFIPWSSVKTVRSNSQSVAFLRDRILLGYIPASAFSSATAQADLVAFAQLQTPGDINER
jgi:hypothetical protein